MKVCGIVVEYNPMHNGHVYHIENTKKVTNATHIVAVMSGNFVQRGEPSIINKWAKTQMALQNGVDLVIELPLLNSISSAEGFCSSAIEILDSLNIVDSICFGSEEGNIQNLLDVANILSEEPEDFKVYLHKFLDEGLSFPKARQLAISDYYKNILKSPLEESMLNLSNNILSIEYLKKLIKLNSKIKPYTIKRISNDYKDESLSGSISSATSIRNNVDALYLLKDSMPNNNYKIFLNEIENKNAPITLNDYSNIILYKLRSSSLEFIKSLVDVSEGLEYKIKKSCENSSTVNELIDNIVSKRYSKTRIQRILLYALFNITKDVYKEHSKISYIRVLGFNDKGRDILKKIKKTSLYPIISMPSSKDINLFHYDLLASDIYSLSSLNPNNRLSRSDLKTPPIYLKNI
ncbi:MAG: nucleotidyltransferase [Clostridium sp.]